MSPKKGPNDFKKATQADMRKAYSPYMSKLDEPSKKSVIDYTDSFHDEVNATLRNTKTRGLGRRTSNWTAEDTQRTIKNVDEAMAKSPGLPSDIELWRGVEGIKFIPGQIISDNAYTSTSISERMAGTFADNHMVRILAPKGTKGMFLDKDFSENPEELEFLLPRGTKFRVVSSITDEVELNVRGRPLRDPVTVTVLEIIQ